MRMIGPFLSGDNLNRDKFCDVRSIRRRGFNATYMRNHPTPLMASYPSMILRVDF